MDYQVFQFLHSIAGKHWLLDWLAVFLADYLGYFLIIALLFLIFWNHRKWRDRLYYLFLTSFSLLIARGLFVETIRFFYHRSRPFKALVFEPLIGPIASSSMPSGHATIFFALAALIFYIDRKYFWYFLVGAFLIGIGRIIVGVHWPLDIVAGAIVGAVSVLVARRLIPIVDSK